MREVSTMKMINLSIAAGMLMLALAFGGCSAHAGFHINGSTPGPELTQVGQSR